MTIRCGSGTIFKKFRQVVASGAISSGMTILLLDRLPLFLRLLARGRDLRQADLLLCLEQLVVQLAAQPLEHVVQGRRMGTRPDEMRDHGDAG